MYKTQSGFRINAVEGHCSISFRDDGGHDGHALKPCPFCGSHELEICNTHSPLYWVECGMCGAECPGESVEEASCATELEALDAHNRALLSAVENWNRRC